LSGIFDVWKDIWKKADLCKKPQNSRQPILAKGFIWPPENENKNLKDNDSGHSAPGRILEVASRLKARAGKLYKNTHSTIHAIHGAVMAVEATELLSEKAQTTFIEALALKHEFEAVAECLFYGIQYNFDVKERIKDIQKEAKVFAQYFEKSKQEDVELNTELMILDCLVYIYRDFNQFDEEMSILYISRKLHFKLWLKQYPPMKFLGGGRKFPWIRRFNLIYWLFFSAAHFVTDYIHWLLKSIPRFLFAVVLWLFGLGFLLSCTCKENIDIYKGIQTAITIFFGTGPIHNVASASSGHLWIICLAVVSGFVHFGVLISHIYSRISRK
jgi:hypothetical protein